MPTPCYVAGHVPNHGVDLMAVAAHYVVLVIGFVSAVAAFLIVLAAVVADWRNG